MTSPMPVNGKRPPAPVIGTPPAPAAAGMQFAAAHPSTVSTMTSSGIRSVPVPSPSVVVVVVVDGTSVVVVVVVGGTVVVVVVGGVVVVVTGGTVVVVAGGTVVVVAGGVAVDDVSTDVSVESAAADGTITASVTSPSPMICDAFTSVSPVLSPDDLGLS